ncbi:MAG: hypothetical protein FWG19_02885 [Methanomassiliicoccaceae archaeon]|nr:hypothetical protein [Methanomassiliicoccaceae archaeon]
MANIEKTVRSELFLKLRMMQHDFFDKGVPVLLLVEGCGCKGVGREIGDLINKLDPRGVEYSHFIPDSENEGRHRPMEYLTAMPAKGMLAIFDRGWYGQLFETLRKQPERQKKGTENILELERFITDNGTKLVKMYLNIKNPLDADCEQEYEDCGRISMGGHRSQGYDVNNENVASLLRETNTANAPWDIIEMRSRDQTLVDMIQTLVKRLETVHVPQPAGERTIRYDNPRRNADLTKNAGEDYKKDLKRLSSELAELQCKLARTERSMVLVFEGWDAAGKGGAIKRVSNALNPRGYRAVSISAPSKEELSHDHLWRFCSKAPKDGMITIFDRSWYGRMMVEPIEGFCTPEEYQRSHSEMDLFERMLRRAGSIVLKFWMEIDKDEQLRRFEERMNDRMKNWKINEEDWRNRSKWNEYEKYADRMIELTNTPKAPWIVVESQDKKYGRIKVLETIVAVLKKELGAKKD